MTPVRVRGLHGVPRDAEAVLIVETLAGDGRFAFRIPAGEAARVARFPEAYSREYVLPGEPPNIFASLIWRFDAK